MKRRLKKKTKVAKKPISKRAVHISYEEVENSDYNPYKNSWRAG